MAAKEKPAEDKVYDAFKKMKLPQGVDLELPPPCSKVLGGDFLQFEKNQLVRSFLVKKEFTNPAGSMQGGFIAAAFDDTFGPLSFAVCKAATASLNLNTDYIRPIYAGDTLTIEAKVESRGFSTINMSAKGYNSKGKLIAASTTNMVIFKNR